MVLLHDCVPNLKHFLSADNLLKNCSILRVGMSKNLTTVSFSETTKLEIIFDETMAIKNTKGTKRAHAFQNYAHSYNFKILNFITAELQLKIAEFTIKDNLIYGNKWNFIYVRYNIQY